MFVLFWLDSNLSDGVGVVSEPEGKPPTQFQTWSNLGNILTIELISVAPHMPYCILNCCTTLQLLICASLPFPRQWPEEPPQSKEWGKYYNCASRACGALFASFFFAEVRSGRMSSYDPRSWGHLPKELFALSLRQIWLAQTTRTTTLGS